MSNVKIVLIVETDKITDKTKNDCCTFVDNTSISVLVPNQPENYATGVKPGQMIEWSGIPKDPASMDCVSINAIHKDPSGDGFNIFGTQNLIGNTGKITGTILADARAGDDETYTIWFTVTRSSDGVSYSYSIDPKLGVNPGP